MIFSIDLYCTKRNTFILKCFKRFTCTNLDVWQKERGNFFNLLQKEGGTQKSGGGSLSKGGFQTWRKLCDCYHDKILSISLMDFEGQILDPHLVTVSSC